MAAGHGNPGLPVRNPNATIQRCPTCCGFHGNRHACPDGGAWPPIDNVHELRPPRSLPDASISTEPDALIVASVAVCAILVGAIVGTAGALFWLTRRSR